MIPDEHMIERLRLVKHGHAWRITVVADTETRPSDFECYDAEAVAAYAAGQWRFVGVIVDVMTPVSTMADLDAPAHSGSVWGVEYGQIGGQSIGIEQIVNGDAVAYLMTDLADEAGLPLE